MKKLQLFYKISLLLLWAATAQAALPEEEVLVEKKRFVSYSYSLAKNDEVQITNQFGDVKFKIWDKDQIRVDVVISSNASTEKMAEEFVQRVHIQTEQRGNIISFETNISQAGSPISRTTTWVTGSKNQLRIDYLVYMPNDRKLTLKNSFGDMYLPEFQGVIDAKASYGTLYADHIRHTDSRIQIGYGKAFIKSMTGGNLKASYSTLTLDDANRTKIDNSFGKMMVGNLVDVAGDISYSSGTLQTIRQAGDFNIAFSSGLKISEIAADSKEVTLNCRYSNIVLDVPTNSAFSVQTHYGSVNFPTNRSVNFTSKTESDRFTPTKTYKGNVGDKEGQTILLIKSEFGNITIR